MIRRLNKNSDLRDFIHSRPKGVIDDIYEVRYYIYGNESKYISPALEREGDVLVAVLASQDLQHLANGILYRKAFYRVPDASYPDGYYDLEFVDNMEIWLGDVKKDEPSGEYLTADDLKTINGESIVGIGDIEVSGVTPEQEQAIDEAITKADAAGVAAEEAKGMATEANTKADAATDGVAVALEELAGKADKSEIPSLDGYATEAWVGEQGYLTEHQPLKTINGESVIGEGNIVISGGGLGPDDFKTINGESIVGEGDIVISGGGLTPEQEQAVDLLTNPSNGYLHAVVFEPRTVVEIDMVDNNSDVQGNHPYDVNGYLWFKEFLVDNRIVILHQYDKKTLKFIKSIWVYEEAQGTFEAMLNGNLWYDGSNYHMGMNVILGPAKEDDYYAYQISCDPNNIYYNNGYYDNLIHVNGDTYLINGANSAVYDAAQGIFTPITITVGLSRTINNYLIRGYTDRVLYKSNTTVYEITQQSGSKNLVVTSTTLPFTSNASVKSGGNYAYLENGDVVAFYSYYAYLLKDGVWETRIYSPSTYSPATQHGAICGNLILGYCSSTSTSKIRVSNVYDESVVYSEGWEPLEIPDIDTSNLVDLDSAQTISGTKTFNIANAAYINVTGTAAANSVSANSVDAGSVSADSLTTQNLTATDKNGLPFMAVWTGTQEEYDALGQYDSKTIYFVI